jgi:HAD superfamily hydrolase (TIGR01490 family)
VRIKALARDCYDAVIKPRRFREVEACIAEHRAAGRRIVLVTGSLDFIMAPLAEDLRADDVIASSLVEANGRFTGELDGPPIGQEEKRRRVLEFARANAIDLSQSYAYGDAIADLPMLEAVGFPHTVNPDKALGAVAKTRGWTVHHWSLPAVRV